MSKVDGMLLTDLPGVGSSLAERMISCLGQAEDVWDALRVGDVERLAEVDGLSGNRALSLCRDFASSGWQLSSKDTADVSGVRGVRGVSGVRSESGGESGVKGVGPFLATSEAEKIHHKLIEELAKNARCKATSNRLKLLMPYSLSRVTELNSRRLLIANAMDFTSSHGETANELRESLGGISRLSWPQMRCERVVVCADDKVAERLSPLKKWCRVLRISSSETWKDYTVFSEVTWVGEGGPKGKTPDNWNIVAANAPLGLVLPERTIAWAKHNLKALQSLSSIRSIELPKNVPTAEAITEAVIDLKTLASVLGELGDKGENSEALQMVKDELWKVAKQIESEVQTTVSEGMAGAQLSLQGSDMLDMLADANLLQRRIASATEEVIDSAVTEANNDLSTFLGQAGINLPRGIFSSAWPPKLDRSALEKVEIEIDERLELDRTQTTLRLARNLTPLISACDSAIRSLIEVDAWLTIADWAQKEECIMPKMVKSGVWVDKGRHLLLGFNPDPVTYGIGEAAKLKGDRQSVALLTGANSGGKTTLLEMLAQITILAHMGLPVPAKAACVGHIEKLHIIAKASGTQSAGALEQTLRKLAEVLTTPGKRLVLADELEAITEPGAAARILAGMFGAAIDHPDICMLTVTHLAPQLLKASGRKLRVDGIEARGLDENLDLIVDRTPRRNHLARSTPELIVRRLVQQCDGDAQSLFADILAGFSDETDSSSPTASLAYVTA
ncbi:MAG: hypothetical protein HOC79_08750 [Euryarchaeota archaeon]|nr:hypothetical protein [Euryarchaeota archaeon]